MKRTVKITAFILSCVMLLSMTVFAYDAERLAEILAQSRFSRIFAPIILDADNMAERAIERAKLERVDRGHFAYVVSATQKLNMETEKYYAELTLINETGLFTVVTVDDVENYNFFPVLTTERVGPINEWRGTFIQFDMRKTDKIQKLETRRSKLQNKFSSADGFYLVNIADERNGIVSFYDSAADIADITGVQAQTARMSEDGCSIIGIDGDSYMGEFLAKLSRGQTSISEGEGNAVIQMQEGEIVRIFSFTGGY